MNYGVLWMAHRTAPGIVADFSSLLSLGPRYLEKAMTINLMNESREGRVESKLRGEPPLGKDASPITVHHPKTGEDELLKRLLEYHVHKG